MNQLKTQFPTVQILEKSAAEKRELHFERRWHRLCRRFLPLESKDSIWRFNRDGRADEIFQGWKLHISATVTEACDLFEKIVPFLSALDVQFKVPKTLGELGKLNRGLEYNYSQIGKFITIYPNSNDEAVRLAEKLHDLTREFAVVAVPFDEQYLPESSVFYRYGAFAAMDSVDQNGAKVSLIQNADGKFVPDERRQAIPDWVSNPFPDKLKKIENIEQTPLQTTYKIFRAITQRGKGGTYQALDLSADAPRFCIVKEGRRSGELDWNGQDGYLLVKNEFEVLKTLKEKYAAVPQVYVWFEIDGNFYFAMEFVAGKSLHSLMKLRRRRFTIKRIIKLAVEIAEIVENIHRAGWIWNDCKPANLIVTQNRKLRPIDFEGAYRIGETAKFDWQTKGFSKNNCGNSKATDVYAVGAVLYYLLTGKFFDAEKPVRISKLRRDVPPKFVEIVENLVENEQILTVSEVKAEFSRIELTSNINRNSR